MTIDDALLLTGAVGFLVLLIGVVLGVGVGLAYLRSLRRFLDRLRTSHPRAWKELGEPTGSLATSPGSGPPVWRYIAEARYEALADPQLTRIGSRTRTLLRYGLAHFVALAVLFVVVFACISLGSS